MKNILITTNVFPPEMRAAAVMAEELAKTIASQGYQVTVAAGYPYHPYGRLFPGTRKQWLAKEKLDGFKVVRGWHLIHPSTTRVVRALVMASRCAGYLIGALHGDSPDLVIAYEGPPLIGPLMSAFIARLTRAKLVSVLYDLYPDIAVEMGVIKNPILVALSRALERLVYQMSDRIVVISEGFRRVLVNEKRVPHEKLVVIPAWLDGAEATPKPRDNAWRREMGISPETFVVLYAGSIGLTSGAESLLNTARQLEDLTTIQILMVGEGLTKEKVAAQAQALGLSNLRFLPWQPRERLNEMQAASDVSLVTLLPGRGRTSVPSKVLGYMAASRPIVAALDEQCDTAEIIRQAACGQVVPPGDGQAIASAILSYYHNSVLRELHGQNGRDFFLRHFEKQVVTNQFLNLVEGLSPPAFVSGRGM